jgi:coenzyme F420-reducing hydrogenase delta subunit
MDPDRVRMVNISAAMAGEFIEKATSMYHQLQTIGPNPLRKSSPGS